MHVLSRSCKTHRTCVCRHKPCPPSPLQHALNLPKHLLNSQSFATAVRQPISPSSAAASAKIEASLDGMLRPEPHVAQHSRREKLRVHPSSSPSPPLLHPLPPQLDFHAAAAVPASCSNSSSSFLTQFDAAGGMWKPDWLLNNCEDLHLPSFPYSPYPLHDVVTSSLTPPPPQQPMLESGSELLLLPSFGNSAPSVWTPSAAPGRFSVNWNGTKHDAHEFCGGASAALAETQGLSLTLSSNPPPELHVAQFEQNARIGLGCGGGADKWAAAGCTSVGARQAAVGPLGPFTGYAAILKSSKFLKPAQKVLDEFCSVVSGSRLVKQYAVAGKILDGGEGDGGCFEDRSSGRCGNSGASSSSFHSSTEGGGGRGGAGDVYRPEFEEKKAKLMYMQEEVCRRYKQYHQQMQMVVSSFETVAGLSSATPYTTLALKAVSKHFRFLKNAISDQLRHVCKVLGEELMASSPSSGRSDKHMTKLKYIDQSLRRQRAGDGSLGFSDNNHPIWRPQRGLPERAVSVLRAWLFDHFLHPYPTDTDKHMLATQTGLSRNQVSNWFINARVRLWKPMVEEIHMLETKGMSGMDLNCMNKSTEKAMTDQRSEPQLNKPVDCAVSGQMTNENSSHCVELLHQEKRSRMEDCAIDTAGLMSFAYPGAMDIGGLGAVSLTLGLRQDEGMQQQQQMRHFGHQMLHDFVG